MSDWDAASSDEGGFAGGPAANAFSDEDGAGFSDEEEEDETLAEMAREKAEAEAKLKEGKPSKTFDEIMAERAAKDQAALLAEKRKEEARGQLYIVSRHACMFLRFLRHPPFDCVCRPGLAGENRDARTHG